jgi:hypothetical protein
MVVRIKKKKRARKLSMPRSRSVNQGARVLRKVKAHGSRTRWKEDKELTTSTSTTSTTTTTV